MGCFQALRRTLKVNSSNKVLFLEVAGSEFYIDQVWNIWATLGTPSHQYVILTNSISSEIGGGS